MKVALMAFRYGPSHGSILQTYALVKTLEEMGCEVTIIDRQRPFQKYFKPFIRRIFYNSINGKLSKSDFYIGEIPPIMMRELNTFINSQLRHQTITLSSDRQLFKIGLEKFDAYIVGSDQTWRPKYVYDIYNYFLNFVPQSRKVKRIAYAPSFGTSIWEYSLEQERKCRNLVALFDAVSVREDDGVILCKDYLGVNAIHVLDPTMLLSGDDYLKFVNKEGCCEYIGYNYLDFSEEKINLVRKISERHNLPVRQLISMGDKNRRKIDERVAPSIEDWLSGIVNSKYVIVDSFHATVFCILFHKSFLTVANEKRGLSRFTSLLKLVGLEDRLITDLNAPLDNLLTETISWHIVDNKILEMRARSLSFLKESLGK